MSSRTEDSSAEDMDAATSVCLAARDASASISRKLITQLSGKTLRQPQRRRRRRRLLAAHVALLGLMILGPSLLLFKLVSCKPNNNNNNNSNNNNNNNINIINNNGNNNTPAGSHQQQLQQTRAELDKQLLRKPQEAPAAANNGDNNRQQNSDNNVPIIQSSTSPNGASSFQCPEQFGYYTDTRDCTKYYVCVFGEVLHESCTGGLRFSRELQTCDWPRNVECLNGNSTTTTTTTTTSPGAATGSSSTTTQATSSSSSIQATTMTTPTSSQQATTSPSAVTSGGLVRAQLPPLQPAKEFSDSSTGSNNQNGSGGGSSMVFADEGSDPQQPSFDEAISPVITADGAIHLHDGSGGTFSLTPNHNGRALAESLSNGGGGGGGPQSSAPQAQNVDVFVKPIQLSNQSARPRLGQQAASSRQQQQQQQQGSSNKILTPASHPADQHKQQQQQLRQQRPQSSGGSGFRNPELNHFSSSDQPEEMSGELDPSSGNGAGNNGDSSIGAQADQESSADQEGGNISGDINDANNNGDSLDPNGGNNVNGDAELNADAPDGIGADQPLGSNQQSQPSVYIPPVMAPPLPTLSSRNQLLLGANNERNPNNNGGQIQSSQLLSINNRQVDPSRQSFRPIIVASSAPAANQQIGARNQQQFGPTGRQQNNQLRQQQQQVAGNNQTANQLLNSNQFASSGNNLNINPQNNRQSRMSANFRQQNGFADNVNNNQLGVNANLRSTFLPLNPLQQNGNGNGNDNHNSSSRLIRLQTSQFEPESQAGSGATGEPQNQFSPPSSFQPRFPTSSRSRNVLFSASAPQQQQPAPQQFGFQDQSLNNNNNNGLVNVANAPINDATAFQGGNEHSSTSSSSAAFTRNQFPANQQQPQLRRSRPPKRQQIPLGVQAGGRRPGAQLSLAPPPSSTTIGTTTIATTPQSITSLRGQQPPQLVDFDQQPPTTQPSAFNADGTAIFFEGDEVGPLTVAPANSRGGVSGSTRPLVAPTTINFQQNNRNNQFQPTIANFVDTTQPSTSSTGSQRSASARQLAAFNAANFEGQRGVQNQKLTATGTSPSLFQPASESAGTSASPNLINGNSGGTSVGAATSGVGGGETGNANALNGASGNVNGNGGGQDQDPQLVANRYLNSAIDALEAGQPFGTVDYDFDILNDNSTERRNPASSLSSSSGSSLRNQTNANSLTRQRQQQQQQQAFNSQDENINLPNGQPANGGQIGLGGVVSSSRNQQQQVAGQPVAGRVRGGGNNNNANSKLDSSAQPTGSSGGGGGSSQRLENSPTKKPRPTNKKITVNHEQAVANNRASTEPARRPEAIYPTPTALQTASKCDNRVCRLPDCKCGDTLIPAGMEAKSIPQIVLLTFDDAVNDLNWEIYEELFTGRVNPNGCPVLATFYVSHEWTDYGQVQTLYSRGHEMASHSVTHSFGEKFSKSQWFKEVNGQREILNMYGGVKLSDVRGMRAPFLQIGGNKMFEMLYDANFTYDSSMPIFENSPPLWPYTLDYQLTHECMITPCPTRSFPGVWEVGMTMWVDLRGGRCSMGDACSNPPDEDGVYEMLMKNFNRHYKSNRAPFGLFYHSAWFNTVHHRRGFLRFMQTVNAQPDVFFVTNWQMLQWMREPTPLSEINTFEPWHCPAKNDRPPACFHPSVCNVKSEHGTRFMKTCQPCPANQQYPWVGATGFKAKQSGGSG